MNGKSAGILAVAGLIVTFAFAVSCAAAEGAGRGETFFNRYGDRDYILDVPSRVRDRTRPLVIFLHGAMGNARRSKRILGHNMLREMDRHGFMTAYLNGYPIHLFPNGGVWNAGKCCGDARKDNIDDAGYIRGFIRHMVKRYNADPDRIYLIGHSNGAMMAYRFACEYPRSVAAIATLSGTLMTNNCRPDGLGGVLHIHGKEDIPVPVEGGRPSGRFGARVVHNSVSRTVGAMKQAGVPVKVMLLDGIGHNLADIDDSINIAATAWKFFSRKRTERKLSSGR